MGRRASRTRPRARAPGPAARRSRRSATCAATARSSRGRRRRSARRSSGTSSPGGAASPTEAPRQARRASPVTTSSRSDRASAAGACASAKSTRAASSAGTGPRRASTSSTSRSAASNDSCMRTIVSEHTFDHKCGQAARAYRRSQRCEDTAEQLRRRSDPSGMCPPKQLRTEPRMRPLTFTAFFSCEPAENFGTLAAWIWTFSPVRGFTPWRAARRVTWNLPKPVNAIGSPFCERALDHAEGRIDRRARRRASTGPTCRRQHPRIPAWSRFVPPGRWSLLDARRAYSSNGFGSTMRVHRPAPALRAARSPGRARRAARRAVRARRRRPPRGRRRTLRAGRRARPRERPPPPRRGRRQT